MVCDQLGGLVQADAGAAEEPAAESEDYQDQEILFDKAGE